VTLLKQEFIGQGIDKVNLILNDLIMITEGVKQRQYNLSC